MPKTLTYITDPNSHRWFIDNSQRLFGEKFANAVFKRRAISSDRFQLTPKGLRYSVDLGRPIGTVPGGTSVGLVFGNYLATFHPGFPKDTDGDAGAFRLETFTLDNDTFTHHALTKNQDMGFIPLLDKLHHVEVFVTMQNTSLAIDVTFTGFGPKTSPGCARLDCPRLPDPEIHTYNFSFLDPNPKLGEGRIGVFIARLNPPGTSDGFFDNLKVEGGGSPQPQTISRATLTLIGHTSQVMSVAFSPDGKRIVSGSSGVRGDNNLKVWDISKYLPASSGASEAAKGVTRRRKDN